MAKTSAERQKLYRMRKAKGEVIGHKKTPPSTPAERQLKWRKNRPEVYSLWKQKARELHKKVKVDIMTHYGKGECACVRCGESRLACLSIDHIDGGGNRQRRGTKLWTSDSFYRWLRNNNYPSGYQTLCMNCQWVKRFENHEERK